MDDNLAPALRTGRRLLEIIDHIGQTVSDVDVVSDFHEAAEASRLRCLNCGGFLQDPHSVLYCSDQCHQEADLVRYTRRALKDGRSARGDVQTAIGQRLLMIRAGGYPYGARRVPKTVREQVFELDKYLCRLCGSRATDIDHINGSSNAPDNLQALCSTCNRRKMEARVQTISPKTDVELWKRIEEQTMRLAKRIAARHPDRICDDPEKWQGTWRHLQLTRKELPEDLGEQAAPGLTTEDRMALYGEGYEDAEERVQNEDFEFSDYFGDIMNRDD